MDEHAGSQSQSLLVGDVGGTNVRFALAQFRGGQAGEPHGAATVEDDIRLEAVWKQPGRSRYASFAAALRDYLAYLAAAGGPTAGRNLRGAALGLAGPVGEGPAHLLHSGWTCDRDEIAGILGGGLVGSDILLANDFMAMARAAPIMCEEMAPLLADGEPIPQGDLVVGGPGTGFGLATLRRARLPGGASGSEWIVVGGEGGHQAFSVQTEDEWRLVSILQAQGHYVSNELIASGSGYRATLDALAVALGLPAFAGGPEEAARLASDGHPLLSAYFRLRAAATMSALGDACIAANALGGAYVAGGVAVRLQSWLKAPEAVGRFRRRGPRTSLLAAVPIRLMREDEAPLKGAAALWLDQVRRGWL